MSKYVLVETVSLFRMRYVIELPDEGTQEWASDTVVCGEAKEFSQHHLDEIVSSTRELTEDEVIALCDEDNDYLTSWTREDKLAKLVTHIKQPEISS